MDCGVERDRLLWGFPCLIECSRARGADEVAFQLCLPASEHFLTHHPRVDATTYL